MDAASAEKRLPFWHDRWRVLTVCLWLSCVGYWCEFIAETGLWLLDSSGWVGLGPGFSAWFCAMLWVFGSYTPAYLGYYDAGLVVFVWSLIAATASRRREFVIPLVAFAVSAVAAIATGTLWLRLAPTLPSSFADHFWPWFNG